MPRPASARLARRLFYDLRLEGAGRGREIAAMGVGAFIGCLPFYGFHLLLVIAVGHVLGLNRLKMYVAANISNPLFAPALILAEVQTGAWVRRQDLHDLTLESIRRTDPWQFGGDLLLGSLLVGVTLGIVIAMATLATVTPAPQHPPHLERTFAAAADRYLEESITAWEFARGKLRRDPIYRATLEGLLTSGGTLVDIGCGQGLTLAVLAEARVAMARQSWPQNGASPPVFDRLVGIEARPRVATMARHALGDAAEIVHAFAPEGLPGRMSAALLFDVLHLMPAVEQERLMGEVFLLMEPGGVLLVRDVDANGGWGFQAVRCGNRLKALAVGRWRQTFHFRSEAAWRAFFAERGWSVETRSMGEGTPFANVLLRLVKPRSAGRHPVAGAHDQSDTA